MKTIITTIAIVLLSTSVAYANVGPILCGTQGNCKNKGPVELSNDVIDLQAQIEVLNKKNLELENKINTIQRSVGTPDEGDISNEIVQNQRIDAVEKRVGVLESLMNSIKTSIGKTIDLLTKLLSKI